MFSSFLLSKFHRFFPSLVPIPLNYEAFVENNNYFLLLSLYWYWLSSCLSTSLARYEVSLTSVSSLSSVTVCHTWQSFLIRWHAADSPSWGQSHLATWLFRIGQLSNILRHACKKRGSCFNIICIFCLSCYQSTREAEIKLKSESRVKLFYLDPDAQVGTILMFKI